MFSKLIYDPIHKYMEFSKLLIRVIDTVEFQRLRQIKQLGLCYYVFPGASHNRFEHSLGVSHLSGELINNIKTNQPELGITDKDVLLVKTAGLVHDLGHACYSHFFDNIFLNGKIPEDNPFRHHENRSIMIFNRIVEKYNLPYTKEDCQTVADLISPRKERESFIYDIVANAKSGLDCDKFDYIVRDTYNLGLSYSFDYSRLFKQARVIDDRICFPEKEIFNIYDLYYTRYRLHKEVYNHPCVKQIEYMILDAFELANDELGISEKIYDMDKFCQLTDDIISLIEHSDNPKLDKAKEIIRRIRTRDLYKYIGETECHDVYTTLPKSVTLNKVDKIEGLEREDVIVENLIMNYSCGTDNPVDNIYFYKTKDPTYCYQVDKNSVSKMLPSVFQEHILRLYCKDKSKIDLAREVYDYIKDAFPRWNDEDLITCHSAF